VARIALVCEPPDGGVAEHVAQLALGLPAHGHEPVVFASAGFAPAARLAAAGCELHALPFRRDYGRPDRDARALAALTRAARGCALVHGHAAKAGVLARLAAAAARRPAVYTPHAFPFVGEISAARRRFGLVVERALAPLTAALICVCEDERDVARAHAIRPRRLVVVHNGCPACAGAAGDVAPGGAAAGGSGDPAGAVDPVLARLHAQGPVVGAVTVLRRQKRLDVLLAATPRILAAVPHATVAIVGDGPEEQALRAAADPRVVFLPFTAPAARHLRALDVYVLPSGWEAFPIGLLEAQACGVPQVATDVGGTREALTPDTGILIAPQDPDALADAVIALLQDPQRRAAMAQASRARHKDRFTVETMVAKTAAVYDTVVG
jgi:glycosyltransferase involved in cell wall biosynthesis